MSLWRQLTRGLHALTRRKAADQDVSDEVQHYFEQAVAEFEAQGLSREEARRAAQLELGSTTMAREQARSYGWENLMRTFFADLKYAGRQLRRNPGFAAVGVLTLALGIGASTAIFSAVNPILFEPLPYPNASRIMMISEKMGGRARLPNFGAFYGVEERNHSFEEMAAMKPWQPSMTGLDHPERFEGQRVSVNYFRTLGVSPVLGRDFSPADDQFHGPNVVILGNALWRRFNNDRNIVGRQINLDDNLYTVIGVMPESFDNALAPEAQLWAPLQYNSTLPPDSREWGHHLRVIGRLRSAVTRTQAQNELDAILHTLAQVYAKGFDSAGGPPLGAVVNPLQDDLTHDVRPALLVILSAVMLVLVIAGVNVTNLLLARSAQRRGEFAMRIALGARQGRVVRQLLTESLVLAILGGALGMIVAKFNVRALLALSPPGLPRASAIGLKGAAFAFGLVLTTLVGILVGLIPALQVSRKSLNASLQQNSQRAAGGHQRMRRALVVSEVALALVLMVSTGLLLRSLQRVFAVDPGFDSSHVLTMQVQEYGHKYHKDDARRQFFAQALEAVRQVPGVISAGFTAQLPLSGDYDVYGMQFEKDGNAGGEPAFRYAVTPGYIETMRIPLRSGRLLNEHDRGSAEVALLLSESFAKRKFPGQDPIGQRVRVGPDMGHADRPWAKIVGVVGDIKQLSLQLANQDAFYVSNEQWGWADDVMSLVVRARGNAAELVLPLRQAIWSVDKDQPIVRVATMENLLDASASERRFVLILFEAFGLAALALAAIGIYGVLSGSVTERTREIGVRAALGASRGDILGLVLRQGMNLTALGVAIGLVGAVAASQALISMLFGISRLDLITYAGVVVLLAAVSAMACWVPAWRAARVDPCITLRAE